jgi:tetratricopeptide (TPR) repeat protein
MWYQRTRESLFRAIEYYEAAVERDPDYAPAYAGLAEVYVVLPSWIFDTDSGAAYEKARSYAEQALALDPGLAGPHAVLGAYWAEAGWQWDESEREFRRAIELNPNHTTARQWYSESLYRQGWFHQGLEQITIARELDPLALINYHVTAYYQGAIGDEQGMLETIAKARELDPNYVGVYYALYYGYLQLGKEQEAADAWTTYRERTATTDRERADAQALRAVLAEGPAAYWREIAGQYKRQRQETYFLPGIIGGCHALLGEADSTMVWLERAYDERGLTASLIAVDRRFDRVRDDERFQALIRRMDLEEAQERYLQHRKRLSL